MRGMMSPVSIAIYDYRSNVKAPILESVSYRNVVAPHLRINTDLYTRENMREGCIFVRRGESALPNLIGQSDPTFPHRCHVDLLIATT
jgi:hypothetical protein